MKVTAKSAHEKTDKLFIYTFDSPENGPRTVVANLTNVYDVGDVVAVALPGTLLEDGSIDPRKVFGIESLGMALGTVEAELDTDLSARFDADHPERTWKVTVEVEVKGHYATDAVKVARKAIGKNQGAVVSAE